MPSPAGYRKALRLFKLAETFNIPIVTLVDTPGAFPSFDAERDGQSEAIATNLVTIAGLKVPLVSLVIGEGGSGGALGVGMGDCVGMLSAGYYGVISPEGAASILGRYKDDTHKAAQFSVDCKELATMQKIYAPQVRASFFCLLVFSSFVCSSILLFASPAPRARCDRRDRLGGGRSRGDGRRDARGRDCVSEAHAARRRLSRSDARPPPRAQRRGAHCSAVRQVPRYGQVGGSRRDVQGGGDRGSADGAAADAQASSQSTCVGIDATRVPRQPGARARSRLSLLCAETR